MTEGPGLVWLAGLALFAGAGIGWVARGLLARRGAASRRALEHCGHRFVSNCDSELIAVYLADRMQQGAKLEDAMRDSIDALDGVFTYLVATADSLGMAKDVMAAKPMVLYESDEFIALASEEVAIRSIFPHEIDTFDPYEGEVRVWKS